MRLAMSGQQFGEEEALENVLHTLKRFSVPWIELWTFNLIGGQGYQCGSANLQLTKEVLDKCGIGVACITNGGASYDETRNDPEKYIRAMKHTIDAARALGAKLVNCYAHNYAMLGSDSIRALVEVMEPIVRYAQRMGITIVLENEADDLSGTPEGMLEILAAVDSDAFKTTFDPANFFQANVEAFPFAYEILREHIAHVHVKNGCQFRPEVHQKLAEGGNFAPPNDGKHIYYPPVPDGAINIEGFLKRLKEDGYGGFCTLEPHVEGSMIMEYYDIETRYMIEKGIV